MQEGQRTHTETEAPPSDLPAPTYLAQGDCSCRSSPRAVRSVEDTVSRQDWKHKSQTESVLTGAAQGLEQERVLANTKEEH